MIFGLSSHFRPPAWNSTVTGEIPASTLDCRITSRISAMSQGQESGEKEPESMVTPWWLHLGHGLPPPVLITGERSHFPFGFVHHCFCSGLSKRMWLLTDRRSNAFPALPSLRLHLSTFPPLPPSHPLRFPPSAKFAVQPGPPHWAAR